MGAALNGEATRVVEGQQNRWQRGETRGAAELSRAGMRWGGRSRGGRRVLRTGPTSQRRNEAVRVDLISTVRSETNDPDELHCSDSLNGPLDLDG